MFALSFFNVFFQLFIKIRILTLTVLLNSSYSYFAIIPLIKFMAKEKKIFSCQGSIYILKVKILSCHYYGKSHLNSLTIPPPKERSQLPISVFATMRQIVSGCAQPTASTATARCAKGILSSLTRI